MESVTIGTHLALAEVHVADGAARVARQRSLAAELRNGGHDITLAEQMSRQLESVQAQFVMDRDRLRENLQLALAHECRPK
jgi:hypothetical protein